MKKLWLWIMLLPSLSFADWHGLSLPDYSSGLHGSPIGGRALVNGQWVGGLGFDLFYWQIPGTIRGKGLPQLYFALDHWWNGQELDAIHNDHGTIKIPPGVWGPGVGVSLGGFASHSQRIINVLATALSISGSDLSLTLPPWLVEDLDKWITLELAGGYRLFGHTRDVGPWEAIMGGKVTVKFDVGAHH